MTEEQLQSMSEQEIRDRFRCAPAYYLQAKLDKKRALECTPASRDQQAVADPEARWEAAVTEQAQWQASLATPESLDIAYPGPAAAPLTELPDTSLDLALPGLEILDAALSACGDLDDAPAPFLDADSGLTQQAILEAALEDYSNWPFRSVPELESESELEAEPVSELERKLTLVLDAAPELKVVLDCDPELDAVLEPELEVVLESDPELDRALESEPGLRADNVTMADFGHRAPRTVPVVSVVMDRKRPNMVRVVGMSTRLAS